MDRLFNVIIIGNDAGIDESIKKVAKKYPSLPINAIRRVTTIQECQQICKTFRPDIVFVDPNYLNTVESDFLERCNIRESDLIFYSGMTDYAVLAVKMQIHDYLLEPLQEPEVFYSISRVISKKQQEMFHEDQRKLHQVAQHYQDKRIRVVTRDSIEFVLIRDIECLEGDGSYSVIHLYNRDKKILVSKRLKELLDDIDNERFMRVHNSWIVNLDYVDKFFGRDSYLLTQKGKMIPISRRNKDELMLRIGKFFD